MRQYLVTGGAGFVGSHIVSALVRRGDQVRVLDNLSTGYRHNLIDVESDVEFVEGDVADEAVVRDAMQGVHCVFHQAALASVPRSVERPLDTNFACVTGTLNILNEARKADVKKVVYAASSSAYGDQPFSSKRESDMTSPLSPYAAAKLAGELYAHAYYHTFGLETVCLRYFNVFGPRQDPDSPYSAVIPIFITRMLAGERPVVFGDGTQSRDFTFVENVVQANLLAAEAEGVGGRTFNVANGRTTSLLELIAALNECLGLDIEPELAPPRVGDVRDSLADISAARKYLGYEPGVSFADGLKRSIHYYRQLIGA